MAENGDHGPLEKSCDTGGGTVAKSSNAPHFSINGIKVIIVHQTLFSVFWNRIKFICFGSASAKLHQISDERDEASRSVIGSVPHSFGGQIRVLTRKIKPLALKEIVKNWIKQPLNMTLFLWFLCVTISGAILFLVMTGMLNRVLRKKSQREMWFEVNNQILNALFTLMCLYQNPKRLYHLVLLCKWRPEDIYRVREVYCKGGSYKPHEWLHMMVVVLLLNANCIAQYMLCFFNVMYRRSKRPALGVGAAVLLAIGTAVAASVYSIVSPLGRDYDCEVDAEAPGNGSVRVKSSEKRYSFGSVDDLGIIEERPEWSGTVLGFWDDISVAYLSLFCSCCLFGWNMERLGFGNLYVHVATFALLCLAPFWILNLAGINIDNETVREALGLSGIFLCWFGLLYGGFWRVQIRKRFALPAYKFCFGSPAASDCILWLLCCWCSLAQEVRTANSHDILDNNFFPRRDPCPRVDDARVDIRCDSISVPQNDPSSDNTAPAMGAFLEEKSSKRDKDGTMVPPSPLSIQKE